MRLELGGCPCFPRCPDRGLPSLCADITGPIILQTYRAIADYEKSSKTEMTVATGDVVDVVEKSESGQAPCPGFGGTDVAFEFMRRPKLPLASI